jgi:hypothetical protein
LKRWWGTHFNGFSRREAWGYGVWFAFAAIVLVPEFWAAFGKGSAPFPTISGTTGALEYDRPWLALVVAGVIVLCLYSALRYPKTRTGVLPKKGPQGEPLGEDVRGDQALPYRTAGGGRFTRSTDPVREISAIAYFVCALVVIGVSTAIVAATKDIDEYSVGWTLYGLILVFWVLIPSLLAWPKRLAVDVPFPTLFSTVRSLERRLRVLALLVAAGLVILLFHLVLYPWPSIIPDLARTHRTYITCRSAKPLSPQQRADCQKLGETHGKPDSGAP